MEFLSLKCKIWAIKLLSLQDPFESIPCRQLGISAISFAEMEIYLPLALLAYLMLYKWWSKPCARMETNIELSGVMANTFNSICEKCEFCVKVRFLSLLYLLLSLNHLIRTFFWLNKNNFMNFFAILKHKKMLCYKFQKLWMCSLQHPILLLHNYIAVDTRHFIFFIHFFFAFFCQQVWATVLNPIPHCMHFTPYGWN